MAVSVGTTFARNGHISPFRQTMLNILLHPPEIHQNRRHAQPTEENNSNLYSCFFVAWSGNASAVTVLSGFLSSKNEDILRHFVAIRLNGNSTQELHVKVTSTYGGEVLPTSTMHLGLSAWRYVYRKHHTQSKTERTRKSDVKICYYAS